jgi:chitinase
VSVIYTTADGSARAPTDYARVSGRLVFAPGETSKTIPVAVVGDTGVEADETFSLRLSSPVGATLARSTATVTIANDDAAGAAPAVSVASASVREGNTGRPSLRFTLTLAAPATATLTFGVETVDGSARAGADYVALRDGQTVTFRKGQQTATVVVSAIANQIADGDRSFTLRVTSAGTPVATATGTIRDDDAAAALRTAAFASLAASGSLSGDSSSSAPSTSRLVRR